MSQKQTTLPSPAGLTLPEKVIEHIRMSDAAIQKAAAAEEGHRVKTAAVAALIPQVVDTLVQNERINPDQREKAAELLRDPVKVLELLVKVASHKNREELSRLGSGVKTASANQTSNGYDPSRSLTDPNVGARTTRVKQSSVALFAGLGLARPQN